MTIINKLVPERVKIHQMEFVEQAEDGAGHKPQDQEHKVKPDMSFISIMHG